MAAATIATALEANNPGQKTLRGYLARGMKIEMGTVTFDGGNYATGGITWAPASIPTAKTKFITFETGTTGYNALFNRSTGKLMVFNGTTEFTNASAISLVFYYMAVGV